MSSNSLLAFILLAAFGVMLTTQSPLLLKTSTHIPELNENIFMTSEELVNKLASFYQAQPEQTPNNIYIFTLTTNNEKFAKNPALVNAELRGMKATTVVFENENSILTPYLDYLRSFEVTDKIVESFTRLNQEFTANTFDLNEFKNALVTRRTEGSGKFTIDRVEVSLNEASQLDSFLVENQIVLAQAAGGKFIIAILVDNVQSSSVRMLDEKDGYDSDDEKDKEDDKPVVTKTNETVNVNPTNDTSIEVNTTTSAAEPNKTEDKSATNTNNKTRSVYLPREYMDGDTGVSTSSSGIFGIGVTLFIVFILYVATGRLMDIKGPNSFVTQPLHIGREH